MDEFYCFRHKHSFESAPTQPQQEKLQVKYMLNKIHDFSHMIMRNGTVITEKSNTVSHCRGEELIYTLSHAYVASATALEPHKQCLATLRCVISC